MANILYCRPIDILAPTLSTPAGATAPADTVNYGLGNLLDGILAKPCIFGSAATLYVDLTFGTATRMDGFFLPNHNLPKNTSVHLLADDDPAFGSPGMDVTIPMGDFHEDGHSPSPWVDLRSKAGYLIGGYRYWRLLITTPSVTPRIGEIIPVGTLRTLDANIEWNLKWAESHRNIISLETDYGVEHIYDLNVKQRSVAGTSIGTDADKTALLSLLRSAHGGLKPFCFVLDPADETDNGLFVRFSKRLRESLEAQLQFIGINVLPLEFDEISRGLPL